MKRENKIIITSVWKNANGYICHVTSEKRIVHKEEWPRPDNKGKFTFSGYNPFPCYEMISTFESVSAWLKANGWTQMIGGNQTIFYDVINSITGEIIAETTETKIYIPVPGKINS